MAEEMHKWRPQKNISAHRDRLQSASLTFVLVPFIAFGSVRLLIVTARLGLPYESWLAPLLVSLGFAALVWLLKAASLPGSISGFLVCLALSQSPRALPLSHTALPALIALFLLTFAATRFGRTKKEARDLAEKRSGRRASQVVANLGVAALCGLFGFYDGCIAALAEAAADTVSSEVGQAMAGPAWSIVTGKRVPTGTDGGISVAGTIAGIAAAALVVAAGMTHDVSGTDSLVIFTASCAGLLFDSLLGATVERRGWLGNDLVNFCSTAFAASLTMGLRFLTR